MDPVSLRDVADGAADLRLDDSGAPESALVTVDLDVDWQDRAVQVAAQAAVRTLGAGRTGVVLGLATHALPAPAAPLLEALTCTLAPGGPGRAWADVEPDRADAIARTVAAAPLAAVTLAGLLGVTARTGVADGLLAESLAYSMLLAGPEYAAWRARTPRADVPAPVEPVLLERVDDRLVITLNRPERHNAFGHAVRDGVLAGLDVATADVSVEEVVLRGNGPSFCSGGDLDEFGTAPGVAAAHLVRLRQSVGHAVHRLGDRVRVEVHGACIGAGVEVPSFASRVEARDGTFFMLPEVAMGLVPGAGGTVSITHRVGRWRTAVLALSGQRLDLDTALRWGLVDARA